MKKGTKKSEPISTAPKPPADPWDALGWGRFLSDWEDDWPHPGGLDLDWFVRRFWLAVVPKEWIKYHSGSRKSGDEQHDFRYGHAAFFDHYGSRISGNKQQDCGYGHAAFLELFFAGAFESFDAIMAADFQPLQRQLVRAITWGDLNFFSDFQQAWDMMRECKASNKRLLFAGVRRHEYFALVAMLEDPRPTYAVAELREMIVRRFKLREKSLTWKALDKVMVRLGIAKPKRGK